MAPPSVLTRKGVGLVTTKLRVRAQHRFQPDPDQVRLAITAILRLSDEARAAGGGPTVRASKGRKGR